MQILSPRPYTGLTAAAIAGLALALLAGAVQAGTLRERLQERRAERQESGADELGDARATPARVPAGVKLIRNVAYGPDPAQRFDVYLPESPVRPGRSASQGAPVLFMVHGGAWAKGDKAMQAVVENKAARWVPKGAILISANYRMLPAADPLVQAGDVALAVAFAQGKAAEWGGDPASFVLMGHSAGAHLVTLLSASKPLASAHGVRPWLGTVALDSAVYDVEASMTQSHFGLYDTAFGSDPAFWRASSPMAQLGSGSPPLLAVCSSRRKDSCPQARAFLAALTASGGRGEVLEQALSHRDINQQLGLANRYTEAVESFLRGLSPALAMLLK